MRISFKTSCVGRLRPVDELRDSFLDHNKINDLFDLVMYVNIGNVYLN